MTWVRIDDEFSEHPKVVMAGPLAIAMQVAGLCYCNRNLTDGFIPWSVAKSLLGWELIDSDGKIYTLGVTSGYSGDDVSCEFVLGILVEHGMWEEVPGGFVIHDYRDYQPTREEVEKERAQKREAGRKGGKVTQKRKAEIRELSLSTSQIQAGAQAGAKAEPQAESKPVPGLRTRSKPLSKTSDSHLRVYAKWRQVFNKTRANYDKPSSARLKAIDKALGWGFTAEDLERALEQVHLEEPQWWKTHHEPAVLFRNQERVEHFLELGANASGSTCDKPGCVEPPFKVGLCVSHHEAMVNA